MSVIVRCSRLARPMALAWATSILFCLSASDVRAFDDLPVVALRSLVACSKTIVVADAFEALEGELPQRYVVSEVLSGTSVRVGQGVDLADEDRVAPREVREVGPDGRPQPAIVAKALLFHYDGKPINPSGTFQPYPSGYRFLTESGEVLKPAQLVRSEPYALVPSEAKWEATLESVRREVAVVNEVRRISAIVSPDELNRAALRWLNEHRNELKSDWENPESRTILADLLASRVFLNCRPEACWETLLLTEIEPYTRSPSFCSVAGRRLLLGGLADKRLSASLRLTALKQLSRIENLWLPDESIPGSAATATDEQRDIIAQVSPLLDHPDREVRLQAMLVVKWVSLPFTTSAGTRMGTKSNAATARLVERYHRELDSGVRWALVDTLRHVEDEVFWQKLTGNPRRLAVDWIHVSRDSGHQAMQSFELGWSTVPESTGENSFDFSEPVTMRFERPDARGVVVHTRKALLEIMRREYRPTNPFTNDPGPPGPPVWGVKVMIPPGMWCMTAEGGLIGDERGRWRSEPIEIGIANQVAED